MQYEKHHSSSDAGGFSTDDRDRVFDGSHHLEEDGITCPVADKGETP
jgi:hypothetical protein